MTRWQVNLSVIRWSEFDGLAVCNAGDQTVFQSRQRAIAVDVAQGIVDAYCRAGYTCTRPYGIKADAWRFMDGTHEVVFVCVQG